MTPLGLGLPSSGSPSRRALRRAKRAGRAAAGRPCRLWRPDRWPKAIGPGGETAAFPLVEAILVAVMVLSAILFFILAQRPSGTGEGRGIDLGQAATDTLAILRQRTFPDPDDPANASKDLGLEEWVGRVLAGDAAVADDVEAFLDEVVPGGARYAVRLNNGVETLRLLPQDDPGKPQGARAAEIPLFVNWTAFANQTWGEAAMPGQEVTLGSHPTLYAMTSSALCIEAPDGSSTGPGVPPTPWVDVWQEEAGRVPTTLPYGVWASYTDAGCSAGAAYARVALPGTDTDFPLYGLQLVIWFGA